MIQLYKRVVTFLLLITNFVAAGNYSICQNQTNKKYFTCGIPISKLEYVSATIMNGDPQIQSNWCWGACIQMVLNYHGLHLEQKDIVKRIYGVPYSNKPANDVQILAALEGWQSEQNNDLSVINVDVNYGSVRRMVKGLSRNFPLIVGISNSNNGVGHAYILTMVCYMNRYDKDGAIVGFIPEKVVLIDPWPGNSLRREFSWQEFQSRYYSVLKVWVTRD